MRSSLVIFSFCALAIQGCGGEDKAAIPAASDPLPHTSSLQFFAERDDVSRQLSGQLRLSHSFEMPEIMGSGCSVADLNNDGRLELIAVPVRAEDQEASEQSGGEGLCRILSPGASGAYDDVSRVAGIRVSAVGMGCYFADIDNDGDSDAVVTSSSGARLYRNDGDFHFVEVTDLSGVLCRRWCTAAVFFDYDRDGWLDLLVVNYVDYFRGTLCHDATGRQDFCGPLAFQGTSDQLFRNLGAKDRCQFEEVTVSSGLAAGIGKGLGALCADFNGDGKPDIYVANDMEPNFLWIQREDGRFREEARLRGCSVDHQGRPQASMGTLFDDLDNDGRFDIFLTHLRGETNTIYRQVDDGVFHDETLKLGMAEPSRDHTGFGVASCDLDLDGRKEVVVVNGRVMRSPFETIQSTDLSQGNWSDYAETNQIFFPIEKNGGRRYEPCGESDPFVSRREVSRGLVAADLDGDGDVDLLTSSSNGSTRFFENTATRNGHWLKVRAQDASSGRDALGAVIEIRAGGKTYRSVVNPFTGYLSQQDSSVHIGLGPEPVFEWIDVHWPDRAKEVERFEAGTADREIRLLRGRGQPVSKTDRQGE